MASLALLSHVFMHVVIALSYIVAVVAVPGFFRQLIYLRTSTQVMGGGFFLFCGATHVGNALGIPNAPFFYVTDHLQAVCIVGFLVFLSQDLARATSRLTLAFHLMREDYGIDTAERVSAMVLAALREPERAP